MIRLIADLMAHQKTRLTPLLKQMAQGVCDQCSLVTDFFFFFHEVSSGSFTYLWHKCELDPCGFLAHARISLKKWRPEKS